MTLALPAINGSWQPESVGFCFTPAGQAALQPQLWYRVQLFRPVQPPVRSQSAAQPTQVEVTLTTRTVDLGFCRTTITTVRCKRPDLLSSKERVGILAMQQEHTANDEHRPDDRGDRVRDRRGGRAVNGEKAGPGVDHRRHSAARQQRARPP